MPPKRRRNVDLVPEAVNEYASGAVEANTPQVDDTLPSAAPYVRTAPPRPDLPAHRQRAKTGIKGPGMNFRYNASQRQLLDYAVAMEDMTKQELIESLVWPLLEERYGGEIPIHPERA